jgi:hypothetical protein
MEGKEPRPPADWSDDDGDTNKPTGSGESSASTNEEKGGDSTIGGPAGEH